MVNIFDLDEDIVRKNYSTKMVIDGQTIKFNVYLFENDWKHQKYIYISTTFECNGIDYEIKHTIYDNLSLEQFDIEINKIFRCIRRNINRIFEDKDGV